ncbi:MAG: Asp23/Gls24 family envelope stress response protein [Candidatus Caldatribacterium sp.]|uniref:Asp23/Gls24 family envelope stress response protein n=1 Tax=Candidatus Caldatribacterium sp. TaxID=2282143 RepID=UPI002997E478|nr:Asp23/Gls24 family envelope stress response protein [Candidatus Caldatribacterium sp.]MCX7730045.1 Asp23/Gls24 family envelope stress response protein [Candidatus Caldatribacterium sp.]MDW8081313.1 Asp23/Gls24 family envelope stress response protein [Candidatus Calescibacterium sp.]
MSEEHYNLPQPEAKHETPEVLGEITIAPDIIATLAAITTMKVPGVTGMAGVPAASLSAIIGKRELNKGVKVEVKDKTVHLEIAIVADIDSILIDVARRIQREVKNVVETKTGMTVTRVDVNIRDVSYREEPKEEPAPA